MNKKELMKHAKIASTLSHSPYSKFKVGAALLTKKGKIYLGTNIENVAYSSALCAERVAIVHAYMSGAKKNDFVAMAVIADLPDPVTPCGECRQVMSEMLNEDMPVYLGNFKGKIKETTIGKLLPLGFSSMFKQLK
ncbi:MAG: cytidine deaminase [Bacilli bacterium]|nr:cytidine deaminase [Bacilli bacterium]